MANQSLDMGCEKRIGPKDWRRNAANTANGNASDAVRDQMMRHDPKLATFNSAYINEKVGFHLQSAVLDEPLEEKLISMLSHVGHMRDPRASSDMVPEEIWNGLPPDPEIAELERRRTGLKGGHFRVKGTPHEMEVRLLTAEIASKHAKRKKLVKELYHQYYFYNSPTWDLMRQANGEVPVEYTKPEMDLQISERAALAKLLCEQPEDLSPQDLHQQRIMVGTLMVDLSGRKESPRPEVAQNKVLPSGAVPKEPCRDATVIQGFLDNLAENLAASVASQAQYLVPEFDNELTQGAAPSLIDAFDPYGNKCDLNPMWSYMQSPALSNSSILTQDSASTLDYDLSQGLSSYLPPTNGYTPLC